MKNVSFEPGAERVYVVDEIENTHFEVRTPGSIDPQTVPAEAFRFPVDGGVTFETDAIEVPQFVSLYVWDRETEELVRTTTAQEDVSLPPRDYVIDLSNTPMKLYLQLDGAVSVRYTGSATRLTFGTPVQVHLGARSLHEQPAGMVITTAAPRDLMRAVSTFGSSLKTLSSERAYPTLRGHPPEITLGEELRVPERFKPPETGIEIGVSPRVGDVFTVASLAHYLGATVVPADGGAPYVEANGVRKSLDQGDGFEQGVRDTLERQFVLDCVLRTEGMQGLDVAERETFEAAVDRDVAALYDAPISKRVATCFTLPDIAFDRPSQWHLLADIGKNASDVELLPFYVSDLAHVRPESERERAQEIQNAPVEIENFFRNSRGKQTNEARSGSLTRSTDLSRSGHSTGEPPNDAQNGDFTIEEVVTPPETDALNHFWSSEYFPIGAAKATTEALRRRFQDDVMTSSGVEVTVVCNEEDMREESEVMYGFREVVNLDVDVHYDLTTHELRQLLKQPTDFLHYIGHVDEEGMRCEDGAVDLKDIDSVGVRAFFLNACQSYEQGLALLEAGAHGGIVTVAEVYDAIATKYGRRVARLMDAGFDLLSAMNIGQDGTLAGGSYAIVGDGRYQLCRPTNGMPVLYSAETDGDEETVTLTIEERPSITYGIGTSGSRHLKSRSIRQLACGVTFEERVPIDELHPILEENGIAIEIDGQLRWTDNTSLTDF